MITLEIPGLPKTINSTKGYSWKIVQGEKAKWRRLISRALFGKLPKTPYQKALIHITRHSSAMIDFDNNVHASKVLIDALKYHGVIEDDSPLHIKTQYTWTKAKALEGRVTITIQQTEVLE